MYDLSSCIFHYIFNVNAVECLVLQIQVSALEYYPVYRKESLFSSQVSKLIKLNSLCSATCNAILHVCPRTKEMKIRALLDM